MPSLQNPHHLYMKPVIVLATLSKAPRTGTVAAQDIHASPHRPA